MSSTYRPRRQSARWLDADCPAGVLAIYDDPRTADRFTIIYRDPVAGTTYADMWLGYRAASALPFHPCGSGLYCEMRAHELAAFRYHNSHRAARWSTLPEDVKRLVRQDLAPQEEAAQ